MKRIFLYTASSLVVLVSGGFGFLILKSPAMREAPNVTVARTPERVERGKYLFHMAACAECHSAVIADRFGQPIAPGGLAKGKVLPAAMLLPGKVTAPNLTSDKETGSGSWTDGQIIRAVREGIGHDGRALFPFMPYSEYRFMSDEDVESIVAFLRSTEPVKNALPRTELDFPVSLMSKFSPKPVDAVAAPNRTDPVAFGKYLSRIYGCVFCHSPEYDHQVDEARLLAGGHAFGGGPATVVTPNLTPDVETGTGTWTVQQFIEKFRQYKDYAETGSPPMTAENFTVMPWLFVANMEEVELQAIYSYLRTVPPIKNVVVTRPKLQ